MEENITVINTTIGVLAKDQVAWQVNLMGEFIKQFNEEKLVVLTGRSFQTLMIRCMKKDDLALIVHCGLNSL